MRDTLLSNWQEIGGNIIALAEAFPADRFDWRAAPEVRTFADQLRHVAFWNDYTAAQLRGEDPDGSANELPAAQYVSRHAILDAVRRSFENVRAVASNGVADDELEPLIGMVRHNGEHYGQMVVYCRLNGVVPPASR